MKLRMVLGLVAVLMLAAASDALAQRGGGRGLGRGFGGVSYFGLLRVEKVQEQLDLTDEQQEQVRTAARELREARQAQRGDRNFQDLSQEERRDLFAQMRQERAKAEKEKLAEILNEQQTQRLNEIYLQAAGAEALNDEEVLAALKITDDQKEKLATARQEAQEKRREAGQELRDLFQSGDREAIQEKVAELRKETDAVVLAVLTDEQKQQLEKMQGEAIDLSPEELRRASGFGGGRRGGGQ